MQHKLDTMVMKLDKVDAMVTMLDRLDADFQGMNDAFYIGLN